MKLDFINRNNIYKTWLDQFLNIISNVKSLTHLRIEIA